MGVLSEVADEFVSELAATSLTSAAICPEFCSNVLATFTPLFDMYLEISFACYSAGFHASRVEKIAFLKA